MSEPEAFPGHVPSAEEDRLSELRRYRILDTPPEAAFDRATRLAARLLQVPIALVSLVGPERQWFKARVGFDVCGTGLDVSFCAHAVRGNGALVVPDARRDPRFAENPLVTGPPGIRFYAGVPLVTLGGHALGTLCIIDTEPRPGLSPAEAATLADLASLVMDRLELRRAELELREAKAAAEAAARAKIDFMTMMGHELRTPLTAVLGYAELLLADADPAGPSAQYAEVVRASGRDLLRRVEAILGYVEGSIAMLPFAEAEVDLGDLVRRCLAALAPAAAAKGVTVSFRGSPAVRLRANAAMLEHACTALLANAVGFSPAGGTVEIGLLRGRAATGLEVRDAGPGVATTVLRAMDEPFRQGDSTRTRAHGGVGLGLAIARRAAEMHGGELTLSSVPGQGTTACVLLPIWRLSVPPGPA